MIWLFLIKAPFFNMVDKKYIDQLPAGRIAEQVNDSLCITPRLVITAPPGSGKSTLLPLTILDGLDKGRIIMLEPRRAAARQIAMRMSHMLGEPVGQTVGYRMRFNSKISGCTRIEVVTEGVMERILTDDSTLDGISIVIFDEYHERSLSSDLCLAMTLEAQNIIRPDLKIVIMSATIDTDFICKRLAAPLIEADGKMYDVNIINECDISRPDRVPEETAACISRAYTGHQGNILVFLPGQAEIVKCADLVSRAFPDAMVLPLYGQLSSVEQQRAIEYNLPDRRKIVLATPIAETSLTIEGITVVIDSGLYRRVRYNPSSGLSVLVTERISLDMARQRTGRAGRLSAGVCYRLWSKGMEHLMKENRTSEIMEADLSSTMLAIAAWGGNNVESLPWITPPPAGHVAEAKRLLMMLGAVDINGVITSHGLKLSKMPCHPRIANMLISANSNRLKSIAADIAALLEDRDPLRDENDIDINSRITMLRRQRRDNRPLWRRTQQIAAHYRHLGAIKEDNCDATPDETGRLIALAYPERIAQRQPDGAYKLASGIRVSVDKNCNLNGEEYLAVASVSNKIYLASAISLSSIENMAVEHERTAWNSKEKKVISRIESRIGSLIISHRHLDSPDRQKVIEVISKAAAKEGESMFDFNQKVVSLQNRILAMNKWHPELNMPDVSTERLLATASEWLPLYIDNAQSAASLRKIDICQVINGIIGYDMMIMTDRCAPDRIKLPGGRTATVQYRQETAAPVVSARLQDCFGLSETPRVDDGRMPVLMELLSPGFKPVQLTQDMHGFWTGTYFEVRKELRRRYPKHRWPENPLEYCSE